MRFFLAPRSHTMGILKAHILLWASQITLCNGLKAWSLSFLGLLYVKLTTVNVLMLFPVKEINVCSGEVWNTAQQIVLHIPLLMGVCLLKIVTYCLLGSPDQFQSIPLTQKSPKIIHDTERHFHSLSRKVKLSNSQKGGKVVFNIGNF